MYRKRLCVFALGLALVLATGASAQLGQGKVLIEYWFGNGVDSNLDNLKANAAFPDNPASSEWLDAFERADWGGVDYFAGRLRAYLTPPQTGEYTFWTASDDDSEVYLSTDDTAANAKLICSVEGWTGWRNYAGTEGVVGPNTKSAAIALEAGKRYYIEGLFTDGTGGGHMSVGWAGPGIGDAATPITSAYVTAFIRDPEPMFGAQNPDPADGAVDWVMPLLKWTPGLLATMHKVYFGTTPELTEANFKMMWPGPMTLHPVTEPLVAGTTYYWRVDELEADGTIRTGKVWSFTVTPLTAHFPSPPDGAMYRPTNLTVSWTAGQNAAMHKIYGAEIKAAVETANPAALIIEQAETSLDASALLEPGKTYYWRVDTVDFGTVLHEGPVWMFSTYDPAGGAVAEYWDNRYLAGQPKVVKNVGTVNFDWGGGGTPGTNSPDENIPVDNFSCRWSAELKVPVTGTYKLYEASDDGSRLYLNGEQIAWGWWDRGTTEDASAALELVAGERYLVVMEMYENGGGATAFLRWSGPGIAKEIIPQGALQIPEMAVGPVPINNATGVDDVPTLSWIAGKTAVQHDVFLGTDANLVAAGDAGTLQGRVAETSFTPAAALLWNTTYYWKVDEVRADGTIVPGVVSSFSTIDRSVIDDFESYDVDPINPLNSPIGWWKLNGDLADSSGNGHNGKTVGDGISFIDDPIRGAVLDLPGGDNIYVEIGAVGLSGNMPTTIACWAKADHTNIPDWTLVFGFTGDAAGAGGNGSHFNIDSIGGPGGVGAHSWGWEETIFTDAEALEWHHYTMTYDGTTIRYYADGLARDTDPGKSNVQNLAIRGDRVHIGKRVTQASSFPGNVSDARVYNYALSPGEVAGIAGAVAETVLPAVWKDSGGAVSSLEMSYVHSGDKAMTVMYDGAGEATCALPFASLNPGSIATLSLWFYGDSTSTADQVYVKLNDQKVALKVNPKVGWWQLAVVNVAKLGLTSLTSFSIGVDGGKGILTVDDIVLNAEGLAPAFPVEVWLEAELADVLGAKVRLYDDAAATGGKATGTDNGDGNSSSAPPAAEWLSTFTFTAPEGVYKVMFRLIAPNGSDDSFWVRIPTATTQTNESLAGTGWVKFNNTKQGSAWHWDEVHDADHSNAVVNWTLPAGTHTLEFGKREDGGKVDAILITNNLGLAEGKLDLSLMPLNVPLGVPTGAPKPVIAWVSFHGGDDVPSTAAATAGFTEAPDKSYTALLAANGYDVVRYIQTGTPDTALLNAADLVIVGRSVASGSFNTAAATRWNTTVTAPMIVMNGYLTRKSRLGLMTGSTIPDTTGDISLTATDPAHPIFAGIALTDGTMTNPFAGIVKYASGTAARGISVITEPADSEATVLATVSAASAATGPAGAVMIAEYPAGATVEHDGGAADVLAGPRLVFLSGAREASGISSETAGMYDLATDGAQMFLNAVAYMLP